MRVTFGLEHINPLLSRAGFVLVPSGDEKEHPSYCLITSSHSLWAQDEAFLLKNVFVSHIFSEIEVPMFKWTLLIGSLFVCLKSEMESEEMKQFCLFYAKGIHDMD